MKNQRQAIRHELQLIGPTMFKNRLDAWWGALCVTIQCCAVM